MASHIGNVLYWVATGIAALVALVAVWVSIVSVASTDVWVILKLLGAAVVILLVGHVLRHVLTKKGNARED